jgi:hypothetical protein
MVADDDSWVVAGIGSPQNGVVLIRGFPAW